ncbi:phosphotransferase [Ruegeria lacuscaerulensis]|uniref:phosphotransferase n=1 Tax=Ruegeria lacuscaerulensis TaxID=55218 RepID=UPI00147F8878|nr:phosphotransferase [Ruegeria lacuscaerulensis]
MSWFAGETELDVSAKEAWPDTAAEAGLPRVGWTLTRLSRRDDPDNSRIVYLAEHWSGSKYAYKFQLRPRSQKDFASHFHLQSLTYRALAHSNLLTVPKPVYLASERQAWVMEFIEGHTVGELVRRAGGDVPRQLNLLRHAATWLDAYHRAQCYERRVFQPKYTVKYFKDLQAKILAGSEKVAAKDLVLAGIDRVLEQASTYEGQETVAATQHGYFHMRNLILDGTRLVGLDISSNQLVPVGHDIAKILLDFTVVTRTAGALPPGEVVPDDVRQAFFEGYTLVGPNDPGVRFLQYPRILSTLLQVPQNKKYRTDAKQRTLKRLRPIAKSAFSPRGDFEPPS